MNGQLEHDVISMFLPITSLLNGVCVCEFLNHATKLYLCFATRICWVNAWERGTSEGGAMCACRPANKMLWWRRRLTWRCSWVRLERNGGQCRHMHQSYPIFSRTPPALNRQSLETLRWQSQKTMHSRKCDTAASPGPSYYRARTAGARRGHGGRGGAEWIPSLLKLPSPPESEAGSLQREHIASDIIQLVGWTPLIELKRITQKDEVSARIVGKLEYYQPLCSVKDRSALRMVEDAEEKGLISPGITTLVEPTSGNMGIGLAYIAVLRGYKFLAVMPAEYSLDKQILLRYLGAEVVLTDPILGFQGQLDKVEQLKKEIPNVHVLDQFANAANPEAHFTWTGPEIWKDTAGKVDIFVAGSGTGGTISGVGKYLKMKNPAVKIICVEPAESSVGNGINYGSTGTFIRS